MPILFIPETKRVNVLLEEFLKKRIHMAILIDEHGAVMGLVTLEDIIEEMADTPKEERAQTGIRIAADFIKAIKSMCQGVHIMAIGWEKRVPEIIQAAGL